MTGASFKLVTTSEAGGFKMTPAQLKAAITPKSKLVMLNSPGNPTGSVYSRTELEAIADVVLDAKLGVISDEIYEQLVFGNARRPASRHCGPALPSRSSPSAASARVTR